MDGQWHDPLGFLLRTSSGLPILIMGMNVANTEERYFYDKLVESIKTGNKIEHPNVILQREKRRAEARRQQIEIRQLSKSLYRHNPYNAFGKRARIKYLDY